MGMQPCHMGKPEPQRLSQLRPVRNSATGAEYTKYEYSRTRLLLRVPLHDGGGACQCRRAGTSSTSSRSPSRAGRVASRSAEHFVDGAVPNTVHACAKGPGKEKREKRALRRCPAGLSSRWSRSVGARPGHASPAHAAAPAVDEVLNLVDPEGPMAVSFAACGARGRGLSSHMCSYHPLKAMANAVADRIRPPRFRTKACHRWSGILPVAAQQRLRCLTH